MPNSCFDSNNFVIPCRDSDGRTVHLSVDVHPGQARIIKYLLSAGKYGITDQETLLRWCICWGLQTLLGHPPNAFALVEAKMNVLQDDQFERQKDCLGISVHKYLTAGKVEAARRIVNRCLEEYSGITCEYWRTRWLSTLAEPMHQLEQLGIRVAKLR